MSTETDYKWHIRFSGRDDIKGVLRNFKVRVWDIQPDAEITTVDSESILIEGVNAGDISTALNSLTAMYASSSKPLDWTMS